MLNTNKCGSKRFLMFIAILIFIGGCTNKPGSIDEEQRIIIDSMKITIVDRTQDELREKQLAIIKTEWQKLLEDSINIRTAALNQMDKTLNATKNHFDRNII